jgi:hypothetical protein
MTAITTRPLSDSVKNVADEAAPGDSLLRFALRADATLTGFAGLVIAASAGPLSSFAGLTAAQEYALGAAFVLYGFVVFVLAAVPSLRGIGIGVAVANVVCTIAAVVVVAVGTPSMTEAGVIVTLAAAVYTGFFAWLQYLGVRRLSA